MRQSSRIRYISIGPGASNPPGGLLARIAALLIGVVVLGVAIFLGAVFLAAIVGFALIGGLILMIRVWWVRRKMEQYASEHSDLDAEYTVVDEQDKR